MRTERTVKDTIREKSSRQYEEVLLRSAKLSRRAAKERRDAETADERNESLPTQRVTTHQAGVRQAQSRSNIRSVKFIACFPEQCATSGAKSEADITYQYTCK